MTPAIFGITNGTLNLVVSLLVLSMVAIWIALIYWSFSDAERRIEDPVLVRVLPLWSVFPFVGTVIYSIIRPPEYLEDMREREIETKAAETRLAMLRSRTCRNCGYEVEPTYLRCPSCLRKLREPCENCSKPLDPRWRICPYCETERAQTAQRPARQAARATRAAEVERPAAERGSRRAASKARQRQVPADDAARLSAAERQRRSLASVSDERKGAPIKPEAPSDASTDRLSAAAAIGPKREDGGKKQEAEDAEAVSEAAARAAKRAAARRSGSKKTSRSPRK
jgi:hypothetical protein